jgi:uncharacterized protein YdiU (UPF0061 family)
MRAKLGLPVEPDPAQGAADRRLIEDILKLLALDYTIILAQVEPARRVAGAVEPVRDLFVDRAAGRCRLLQYSERMSHIATRVPTDLMLKTNPKYVLRNHLGELADPGGHATWIFRKSIRC